MPAHFGSSSGASGEDSTGTLFLKEIGELSSDAQRTLLYALPQTDNGDPGEGGPRLISATTLNLDEETRAGRFRAELFYRINGVSLRLPALRQRKEDIPELVDLFLNKQAAILGRRRPVMDGEDLSILREFSWPGNIRELENVVKKIVVLNDAKAVLSELGACQVAIPPSNVLSGGSPLKAATRAASAGAERQLILDALNRTRWNRKRAAQELQISYKALLYKLKRIGTNEPEAI
jgi:two-component system response regulator AtoC